MTSVNRANRVPRLDLVAVLAVESLLVLALHQVGAGSYDVPVRTLGDWLATAEPTVVLVAVARLVGLAIGYWLLATTVLYAVSYHLGLAPLTRLLHWITLPVVRHLVQGVTAMSLTGASLLGPSVVATAPAWAQHTITAQNEASPTTAPPGDGSAPVDAYAPDAAGWPAAPGDGSGFWLPAAGLTPQQPAGTQPYTVESGDHFWKIAEAHLRQAAGRDVTDDEVAQYWVRVVEANRSTIRSGDPDLIYPLERITLPPVFAD